MKSVGLYNMRRKNAPKVHSRNVRKIDLLLNFIVKKHHFIVKVSFILL
jgi:hypothetical protein